MPFRELPRMSLNQFDGGFQIGTATEMLNHLPIAHRLRGRLTQRPLTLEQSRHLLHKTLLKHDLDSTIYPAVERLPRPIEQEDPALFRRRGTIELLLPLADRGAGLLKNLKGPNQAARVVAMETLGRSRIALAELTVQGARLSSLFFCQLLTQGRISGRAFEDPPEKGLQVERRPPHKQDLPAPLAYVRNRRFSGVNILGKAEFLVRVDHVDQMMGHGRPLLGRGFGRPNIHAPIEGHRIERDDLRTQVSGKRNPNLRLPTCRWTGQKPTVCRSKVSHLGAVSPRLLVGFLATPYAAL